MTAHHVAALTLAVALIIAVLYSPNCHDALQAVSLIASTIIGGVFGHARNQGALPHGTRESEGKVNGA